uniref:Uncharacterized protein n=1 Tax=Rhizophora mucronata TaxID=61149 RepID=A0A2P2R0T8_RHIMU
MWWLPFCKDSSSLMYKVLTSCCCSSHKIKGLLAKRFILYELLEEHIMTGLTIEILEFEQQSRMKG